MTVTSTPGATNRYTGGFLARQVVTVTGSEPIALVVAESAIGGDLGGESSVKDPKATGKWAQGRQPHPDTEQRLRAARQILEVHSPQTARVWSIGMNPPLDDDAPAQRHTRRMLQRSHRTARRPDARYVDLARSAAVTRAGDRR